MSEKVEYVVIGLGSWGSSTAYHLARGGHSVVGLEQFEFGHNRGASHDTSRILRHSYHTPGYVRLTFDAYDDWATLEADSGERLVTTVGGLDIYPAEEHGSTFDGSDTALENYTSSMRACGVAFEELSAAEAMARWPMYRLDEGTRVVYQERGSIVPAAHGTATMQAMARRFGADLRDNTPVTSVRDLGAEGIEVVAGDTTIVCRRLIVCADAWTNQVLSGLGVELPLVVTLEQVTYFQLDEPERFAQGKMPLFIWMDEPCFYGFPTYGEPTVKAAQDCGGAEVTGDNRPFEEDPTRLAALVEFMRKTFPDVGEPIRSKTCLYTLPPDRDFVLGPVPGHEAVFVGLGAGHGFKFSPTVGRMLAELASKGETAFDITPFRLDRPALIDPDAPIEWRI